MSDETIPESKDVTEELIVSPELERELEEEIKELGKVEIEEAEEEPAERRLMSEEEFMRNIDEYRERMHGLTILIDSLMSMLVKKARQAGAEVDTELWDEVAKPSLNVFFWYEELVEGQAITMSPRLLGLVGLGATVIYARMVWKAYKEATKSKARKAAEEKEERKKAEEQAREEKREEMVERVRVKTELMERVQANIAAG
ncbi:hypothetical protein JCM16138_16010 [Thermococcus atlanticus]